MRGVIIFVFGAVCGASGALFWLQKDYKKRLEKMEEEYYSRKNEENEGSDENKEASKKEEKSENGKAELRRVEENQRVLVGLSDKFGYTNNGSERGTEASLTRENVVNYSDFSRENEENSVSLRNSKSDTRSESDENDEIYEISGEDFEFSRPEYPKKCIKYFAKNDIFVNYEGEIVDTVSLFSGGWHENLKRYMPEKMWVRDDKYGCDYEISVVDDEYISDDFDGQEGV